MLEEDRLLLLYNECISELLSIGIDMLDEKKYGKINIKLAKRECKRYGCCKQDSPDKKTKVIKKYLNRKIIYYEKYNVHNIEISNWVMLLNDKIIKNTIIHELIHCFKNCNNHGKEFKYYADYINNKLGYNISRLGNKNLDLLKSNINIYENESFKYKVTCMKCGQIFYRKRLNRNFLSRYRCGICKGKFIVDLLN